MPNLLYVMAGGALGAGLRFEIGRLALRHFGSGFPWGTLFVNLAGGLAMGLIAGFALRGADLGEASRLFLAVGVLGGFTTFSAFSLETATMLERGAYGSAGSYVLGSVLGSILLLFLGLWLARGAAA